MLLLSKYTITEIDPSAVDVKRYNKKIMSFVAAITFAFHALLLTLPFVFTWSNSELFEFNKMLAVYGFTVVIGSLWLARMIREKRFIWRQDPIALLVLIFLTGQAVATLFSIHFRTSIFGFYSRLNGGFLSSLSSPKNKLCRCFSPRWSELFWLHSTLCRNISAFPPAVTSFKKNGMLLAGNKTFKREYLAPSANQTGWRCT